MTTQSLRPSASPRALKAIMAAAVMTLGTANASETKAAPAIRAGAENPVPRCVTPERLMAFVAERNPHLDPRYANIARLYQHFGDAWRVRWDYAFFQMAIETNFLSFRRGDGSRGDVRETQNNFAGIGATGGGVHGERFADVAMGVHAQIQHLVAYSGEHLADPIARRTRERQDDIIEESNRLGRPVTFADLARRWATDRAYGRSIDYVAGLYRARFCTSPPAQAAEDTAAPTPQPARRDRYYPFSPPSGLDGPKPDKLAGPEAAPAAVTARRGDAAAAGEVLPWLATPEQKAAMDKATKQKKKAAGKHAPKSGAKAASAKPTPKIKTIWSSGETEKQDIPATTAKAASQAVQSNAGSATANAPMNATVNATPADGSVAADQTIVTTMPQTAASTGAPDTATGIGLPTFRIAPLAAATPSHLGGPVPQNLAAAATATAPAAKLACRVLTASYGGSKTLLVHATVKGVAQYTALTVIDGFEKSLFAAYARTTGADAEIVGTYPSRDAALADARVNCPEH